MIYTQAIYLIKLFDTLHFIKVLFYISDDLGWPLLDIAEVWYNRRGSTYAVSHKLPWSKEMCQEVLDTLDPDQPININFVKLNSAGLLDKRIGLKAIINIQQDGYLCISFNDAMETRGYIKLYGLYKQIPDFPINKTKAGTTITRRLNLN